MITISSDKISAREGYNNKSIACQKGYPFVFLFLSGSKIVRFYELPIVGEEIVL